MERVKHRERVEETVRGNSGALVAYEQTLMMVIRLPTVLLALELQSVVKDREINMLDFYSLFGSFKVISEADKVI